MRRLLLLGLLAGLVPQMPASAAGHANAGAVAFVAPASSGPAARAEVAAMTRASAVNDRDGNKVFDDLDAAFATQPGASQDVIVSFAAGVTTAEGVAQVRSVAAGATVQTQFSIIPAYAGRLTASQAAAVAQLAAVRQIELDSPGQPESDTATTVMGSDAVVDQMRIDGSLDGASDVVSADDITIAVLDTGFDTGHVDVDGKLETFVDIADGVEAPYDSDGHGTHVTSIAAGWGIGDAKYRGVAPGAGIVGLRIENESHALQGYEWIVENRDVYDIRVATISFGFGVATDGTTALERAVDTAWDAGVVCFKSNGNSGPGLATMTVPAAARGILAMGSLLDPSTVPTLTPAGGVRYDGKSGFVLSEYSSRGPTSDGRVKPDLAAPGESIMAADAGTPSGYTSLSGTSMASPFGAGTAALVLAADPSLQPDEVRDILIVTAEDFGATGPDNQYGHGRLQVWHAVQEALRRAGVTPPASTPPSVPRHLVRTTTGGQSTIPVTLSETTFPFAVTAISTGTVHAVRVTGPGGVPVVSAMHNNDRQHHFSFQPTATGAYTVEVVSSPNTPIVVDVSYGAHSPG